MCKKCIRKCQHHAHFRDKICFTVRIPHLQANLRSIQNEISYSVLHYDDVQRFPQEKFFHFNKTNLNYIPPSVFFHQQRRHKPEASSFFAIAEKKSKRYPSSIKWSETHSIAE